MYSLIKRYFLHIYIILLLISCEKSTNPVKVASFHDFYNSKSNKILLDVRTPEECKNSRAFESTSLNFYDKNFKEEILKNLKESHIYIYCRSGRRSEIAVKYLLENGYSNVFNIASGIIGIDPKFLEFSSLNN
tara:strand:- start:1873 stop:2271 length:399 start_codon:yes stop_codon:yes gene_type:complete